MRFDVILMTNDGNQSVILNILFCFVDTLYLMKGCLSDFLIFYRLNLTALVVAIYEWFSPFGLNPWGRQRTKNFSISSALWVVWGRLFSHLVAFKAPKSWPNKFLINVWGGFSVIFVASYTANIAALFAGMFFERHVDVNDRSVSWFNE